MTPTERALSVINHYNLQIKSSGDVHKVLIELSQELEKLQEQLKIFQGNFNSMSLSLTLERDQLRAQLTETIARHNEQIRMMCAGKDKYENDNAQLRAQVAELQKVVLPLLVEVE